MSLTKHQQKLYKERREKEMKERLKSGQTPEERARNREGRCRQLLTHKQGAKWPICLATFAASELRRNLPMDLVKHCEQQRPK
jgi:hypothetical protein